VKPIVLGSARTGLIFTGLQEGAQPDTARGLTPPGRTEQGIPYHGPSCCVPVGASGAAETHSRLGSAGAIPVQENSSVSRAVCVVFSAYLYRCCSCSLCLLFCSTALILTHQFLPVSFHSSPQPGGGRGGRVALLLPAAAKPEH